MTRPEAAERAAVLISGGLDSAILLGEFAREYREVHPLYVRAGHVWESVELEFLTRFLAALGDRRPRPLQVLDVPVGDLLPDHWSVNGQGMPAVNDPDETVYLPGRNVLLLGKAMIWCHLRGVGTVALGILKGNPFADATPGFFRSYTGAVNLAVGGEVRLRTPYSGLGKTEVLRRGHELGLPLGLTLSCLNPAGSMHCGDCNKCTERRLAFARAGIPDPTEYRKIHPLVS